MKLATPIIRKSGFWLLRLGVLTTILLVACGGGATTSHKPSTQGAASVVSQAVSDAAQPDVVPEQSGGALRVVSQAASDAAQPDVVPEQPGGSIGFTHFVFEQAGDDIIASLVEGPRGPQVRVPISYPRLQELLASGDPIPEELQMSREQLALLVEQLDTIRAGTEKYSDANVAIAEGYVQITPVVPNMGAHFHHFDRVADGVLNLAEPDILMYDRLDELSEWRLVGTAFVLPSELAGDEHPEVFAGPLDNWHMHYWLCSGAQITGGGRTMTAAKCQEAGGSFVPTYGWMIHAWIRDDNPLGVFSMWNPNIPPLIRGATQDSWDAANALPPESGLQAVTIQNFEHLTIEVKEGESISWVNADGVPHSVTSGSSGIADGGFDSNLLGPGQAFRQRFDQHGAYPITCSLHPQMNGVIIVNPSAN